MSNKYVFVGKDVYIGFNCRIEGVDKYRERIFTPRIILSDGVSIQQNVHITCASTIIVGNDTAIAANVTITDINHPYDDVSVAIEKQDIETKPVSIGADCKIYNNVVILPGVNIGKHCVIGANSVVTHDLPDYSVAVGAPAQVVKQYDFELKRWVSKN